MISLEGRKTLITGRSRGIGAETAILFAIRVNCVAPGWVDTRHVCGSLHG
jgi:NAD(P)-dependent dehydrogenase (short-subunit alcohol dehydrogenase family)